jgi:hypothetical protein
MTGRIAKPTRDVWILECVCLPQAGIVEFEVRCNSALTRKIPLISLFLTFLIEKEISSPKKVPKEVFGDNFLYFYF